MADNDNPDTNMDKVDKKVLKLAALLDATMRFHVEEFDLDEMEINYIQTWLRKERDPLLVTILATTTGDRDPKKEDEGSSTEK
jgi:hypothetical protein|tara:strand:+ start:1285 stop:1533 length:249 start_codon:yes stop_codon:yes gene_type:complete